VLPIPPDQLTFGKVSLRFERMLPGDESRGMVPAYHFRILNPHGQDVGHLNFRVGDTRHVRIAAGHIGFAIHEPFRGHHYALQASQAIAPFVRQVYPAVTITCDPDNHASRRTIEKLGARFMDQVAVPPDDPQYLSGSREKRRYEWIP
jgi:tagatose 1,6-diphosphate aldolase